MYFAHKASPRSFSAVASSPISVSEIGNLVQCSNVALKGGAGRQATKAKAGNGVVG